MSISHLIGSFGSTPLENMNPTPYPYTQRKDGNFMSKADNLLDSQNWVVHRINVAYNKCYDEQKAKEYRLHLTRLIQIRELLSEHILKLEAHK